MPETAAHGLKPSRAVRRRLVRASLLATCANLAALTGLWLGTTTAHAQDATWTGAEVGEWVDSLNWSPTTVPTGTATFTSSGFTNVVNDKGIVTIGAIDFVAGAQAYTITIDNPFLVNGAGITNNSANAQTFNITSGNSLVFQNGSTANNGTGAVTYNNNGFLFFRIRAMQATPGRPSSTATSPNSTT